MSSQRKVTVSKESIISSVVITAEEAAVVRELLDSPQVAFPARHAALIGRLYAKLPAPKIPPQEPDTAEGQGLSK